MNGNEDHSNLGFDLEIHREAMEAMTKAGISPVSIDAILRARNVALVDLPGGRLSVGAGNDEALPRPSDGTSVRVVYTSSDAGEAEKVRTDIERYFIRHFPGRTTQNDLPTLLGAGNPCVYLVLRKPL